MIGSTRRALTYALVFAMLLTAFCGLPLGARADGSIITSTPTTTATEGVQWHYHMTTSVAVQGWPYSSALELTTGSWNAYYFDVYYTPELGDAGPHTVSVGAELSDGTSYYQNFTLVIAKNPALVFSSTPPTTATEGVLYEYTVTTTVSVSEWIVDADIITPAYINSTAMYLGGTPSVGRAGTHAFHIKALTAYGYYWQNYTLTVAGNPDLIITTSPRLSAYSYEQYRYQASGSYSGVSYSMAGPSWLHISSGGLVTATPTLANVGNYSVSIRAQAIWGGVEYQNFTLAVGAVFTAAPDTTGQDGVLYEDQATTNTAVSEWTLGGTIVSRGFTLTSGISTSVLITGTPSVGSAGSYTVVLGAHTSDGWHWMNYTLVIAPDLTQAFSSSPVTNATANISYSYQVTSPYTVTGWSLTGPEWLHVSSSGLISGTAPNGTDGDFAVSVLVTLQDGSHAWQNYTLTVEHQPYTLDDGMAMAFGLLAFAFVLSAMVGVIAAARRHQ